MSKRKTAASSGRAAGGFGGFGTAIKASSALSYLQEPLDYSQISEPSLGVIFKNLSKKDETTKAKALDDLASYLGKSSEPPEQGIAELWIRLFPRLSIDNSRRVRQLAQVTNGRLCSRLGKRTVKYMPQLVGPWLSAQFDNDKAVSKAARDALHAIFPDASKVAAVWSIYSQSIIDYCKSAILTESASTLNDERTISPEDAELVFARTISSCTHLATSLMQNLDEAKCNTMHADFADLLDEKVFAFAVHPDASLRRSVHQFVRSAVSRIESLLSDRQRLISNYYVYKGLPSEQQGSRIDYLDTLIELSSSFPEVWQHFYSGKKTPLSRLIQFLEKGSQSAQALYWTKCVRLIEVLPFGVVDASIERRNDLVAAFRTGLNSKEDRIHNSEAWRAYIRVVDYLAAGLTHEQKSQFYGEAISPLIINFTNTESETWTMTEANAAAIFSSVELDPDLGLSVETAFTASVNKLIESIRLSQPEQSQHFQESQARLGQQGVREAELLSSWLSNPSLPGALRNHILNESTRLISVALDIVADRKGKPYGAALLANAVVKELRSDLLSIPALQMTTDSFSKTNLPDLVLSPSGPKLIAMFNQLKSHSDFAALFETLVKVVLHSEHSNEEKLASILGMLGKDSSAETIASLKQTEELQKAIKSISTDKSQPLLIKVLSAGLASQDTKLKCINFLEQSLDKVDEAKATLESLNTLASQDRRLLNDNLQLIARVLDLRDSSDDEVADLAALLSSRLSTVEREKGGSHGADVVRRAISNDALTIDGVLELANTYLDNQISAETFLECFPTDYDWQTDLRRVSTKPHSSLSICSPLKGALRFVTPTKPDNNLASITRTTRHAVCMSQLLAKLTTLETYDIAPALSTVVFFCTAALALIEDKMSVGLSMTPPNLAINADIVATSGSAIAVFVQELASTQFEQLVSSVPSNQAGDLSPVAYYTSLAKLRWLSARSDQSLHLSAAFPDSMKPSETFATMNIFDLTGILACEQPPSLTEPEIKLSNLLVSGITASDLKSSEQSMLQRQLLTLTMLLSTSDAVLEGIAKQRIMFLVKHLLSRSTDLPLPAAQCELVLEILFAILPAVSDMYGGHWLDTLNVITALWRTQGSSGDLPCLYASLRLYSKLIRLGQDDSANEDLVEALQEKEEVVGESLVGLLISAGAASEQGNRPFALFCSLLSRMVSSIKTVSGDEDLYPLLHASSSSIQYAAFGLLRRQVQSSVERISVDTALDKSTARLPNALLSSILEVPEQEDVFDEDMSSSLQTYLYSWRLIFEHMRGASFKVQNDYGEQIKDGGFLGDLLSLTLVGLGLTRGKPADVSQRNLAEYTDQTETDPTKDKQWLLAHLYFLALRHLPSLVKTWMFEQKSRQLPITVQSWTAKYVSPVLILDNLDEVSKWSQTTVDEDPEYEKMQVTVGTKSKEISVKYVVDEQTMAIKVVLPEAYPLMPAQVIGVNRVAVKEEKWQSWLRNCQGVITFSNGSITDGLNAWRRNVTGALKGQTECAICYSIISADRQLPSKRCPTCKNLFHSSCLFKWFKTSNASTCPLCRNPFNFNG